VNVGGEVREVASVDHWVNGPNDTRATPSSASRAVDRLAPTTPTPMARQTVSPASP
jgi:hypothetical protein